VEVKGSALGSIREFVMNEFGREGFDRWLDALPDLSRGLHAAAIRLDSWYPLREMMIEPTEKICELFYGGDIRGAWEGGRFSADFALHGIYRLFVKLGSVESLINRASLIFSTYYKPSALRVAESAKNRVSMQITLFPEMHTIVERRIGGWMERAVEISGQKNVKVEIAQSLTVGDPCTEFVATWD
jgi:hypothetical protein